MCGVYRPEVPINGVARKLGLVVRSFGTEFDQELPELRHVIRLPRPVYFEDDLGGFGFCAVCGKRGTFYRCSACGLLAHLSCVGSTFAYLR